MPAGAASRFGRGKGLVTIDGREFVMIIKTRRASLEGACVIAPLFDQYRVFYHQPSDLSLAEQFIRQRLSHDESTIFLALSDASEAIGFTQLYPFFSSVAAQRVWVLNDLYVAEHWRGSGAGSALLRAARAFAEKNPCQGAGARNAGQQSRRPAPVRIDGLSSR